MKPPPIKILYVLLWFPKPSETFVFREVEGLRALGVEVEVFTLYGALRKNLSPAMRDHTGSVTRVGLRGTPRALLELVRMLFTHPLKILRVMGLMLRPWRSWETAGEALLALLCAPRLARFVEERGIRHIHADWASGAATLAWGASRLTGVRFSFTGRAGDIYPPDGALEIKAREAVFVRTDVAGNVPYLSRAGNIPGHKIRLVRAGLTLDPRGPMAMPFSRSGFTIIGLGRFVRKKGFDTLLQALLLVRGQGIEVRLLLAGSGPEEQALRRLCGELGLEAAVDFVGFVSHDQVPALLRRGDCLAMPCRVVESGDRDGIPNVILEAMTLGLPVVATDVAGVGEVVRNGETGVLAPADNLAGLAEGILEILRRPEESMKMALCARDMVLGLHSPELTAKALARLYLVGLVRSHAFDHRGCE